VPTLINCKTQAEADKALSNGHDLNLLSGSFYLVIVGALAPNITVNGNVDVCVVARGSSQPRVVARGSSQPHVEARESSQPRVEAWGSSQPRVEAWGSSQPRVEARESSQPRVVAWGSSQPRVVARGSSQPHVEARESSQPRVEARESSQPRVEAWGFVQISTKGSVSGTASANVAVLTDGAAKIKGGKQTVVSVSTPAEWCEYYGVVVRRGVAILYKAVNDDYTSCQATPAGQKIAYAPGTKPVAPDWDGGARECGGGLHFSPTPAMARSFNENAVRFMACPVKLADISVHWNGNYPEKCKARGVAGNGCYEVDEDGEPVQVAS
jgi:hypothetical protein